MCPAKSWEKVEAKHVHPAKGHVSMSSWLRQSLSGCRRIYLIFFSFPFAMCHYPIGCVSGTHFLLPANEIGREIPWFFRNTVSLMVFCELRPCVYGN